MTPLGPFPAALQPWENFYLLAGTAAATLTGLMFVAVTFGAGLVTRESAQSARAFLDPTYLHFVQVLLTACLVTMPTLEPTVLGGLLIALGGLRLLGLSRVYVRYLEAHRKHGDVELSDWVLSIVLPLGCHLLILATGIGFVRGDAIALTGLAVANLILLSIGIHGAWELFVWMAVVISERRTGPSLSAPSTQREKEDGSAGAARTQGPLT